MICNICRTSIPALVSPRSRAPGKGRCRTCHGTLASENQKKVFIFFFCGHLFYISLDFVFVFFFFISLLVECRNLTGFTFTNFFFFLWTRKALTLIPDSDLPDTWYYFHNVRFSLRKKTCNKLSLHLGTL